MIIQNLSNTNFEDIIECFLEAFSNYFVPMPTDDQNYYRNRWKAANVNFELSYGMFDKNQLVGFILHAVDVRNNTKIAYNTGTGVIPNYRGKGITKLLYKYALENLQKYNIEKSTLEVITENTRALKTYENIGFKVCKTFYCYKGSLNLTTKTEYQLSEKPLNEIDWKKLPNQEFYSWDNQKETIINGNYQCFSVMSNYEEIGYFIINSELNYLAQFDTYEPQKTENWYGLFSMIQQISSNIKTNNVDNRLIEKIKFLKEIGFQNTVNQYEMELNLR
ncbi:GNAT family acetyltransferase [Tenacibaculum holothuriorum]|uniref:GNAT family acetyltransferase n=1 Tax=Tenacibaculum holothuriorum TaxID=1635173 RepID=A0A1Y2PID8_9FLAO|nr:GNAT family N-acetyltransferase [Tenacibaculum holothuriorum]OSY89509.1 GNAT family acetyltransferase [Tenacibaculum holothuriorum]